MFHTFIGKQLHADADPQKWYSLRPNALLHRGDHAVNAGQGGHTMRKSTNTGQNNTIGVRNNVRISRDTHINRARSLQRIMHRMQITCAIINQRKGHGLERPLGRWNGIRLAWINFDRLAQRTGQGLEAAFDNMVVVCTVEVFNMQRDTGAGRKAVEPMFNQLGIPFAKARHAKRHLPHKIGAPRNIERTAGQRLVHRRISRAITRDATFIAKRLQNGLANRDARVFGCMVLINMQVAHRLDLQVNERMSGQLLKHMVEKTDACGHFIHTSAVKVHLNINGRFVRLATDRACTHGRRYSCASAFGKLAYTNKHLDFKRSAVHLARMTDEHVDSLIPYDDVVQEALRAVVGRVLGDVARDGLPGDHHFYITFKTQAPGVAIPQHLHERFPDEMTIVLQHKYWDLKVEAEHFEVGLSFSQIPSHLFIPYSAITAFVDPAVDFALQFRVDAGEGTPEPHEEAGNDSPPVAIEDGSNVVSVDFGRKK